MIIDRNVNGTVGMAEFLDNQVSKIALALAVLALVQLRILLPFSPTRPTPGSCGQHGVH